MKFKKIFLGIGIVFVLGLIFFFIPENRKELKTSHFTFLYSKGVDSIRIAGLAGALEENYVRIGRDLNTTPSENVEVNIYGARWRYIKETKNWGGSGNIEGIAKMHFLDHAWGEEDSKKVAVHEFAHTVTLKLLLESETQPINPAEFDKRFATFPVWLWEGISVYEAQQFVDPKTLSYLSDGYPSLMELNDRLKGGKIYTCGYTVIEYILSKYGHDRFIQLISSYGDLKRTFDVSDAQFSQDWYAFVKEKYLK